jgi:nucleotidyltransferase substrate binding protein (TIGR01987 family)
VRDGQSGYSLEATLSKLRSRLQLTSRCLEKWYGEHVTSRKGRSQRFEYSFELAWKTVKDFLEAGGVLLSIVSPRQVLKDAFAARIIPDGQVWIDMLDHRNLLSHTYDSSVYEEAVDAVADRYLPAMQALQDFFSGKSRK